MFSDVLECNIEVCLISMYMLFYEFGKDLSKNMLSKCQ